MKMCNINTLRREKRGRINPDDAAVYGNKEGV